MMPHARRWVLSLFAVHFLWGCVGHQAVPIGGPVALHTWSETSVHVVRFDATLTYFVGVVHNLGDQNGNGRDELAVFSSDLADPGTTETMQIYEYTGGDPHPHFALIESLRVDAAAVQVVDDMNDDGLPDLVIIHVDADHERRFDFFFSPLVGLAAHADDESPNARIHGRLRLETGDFSALAQLASGDFDGDGRPDLIVPLEAENPFGEGDAAYLFNRPLPSETTLENAPVHISNPFHNHVETQCGSTATSKRSVAVFGHRISHDSLPGPYLRRAWVLEMDAVDKGRERSLRQVLPHCEDKPYLVAPRYKTTFCAHFDGTELLVFEDYQNRLWIALASAPDKIASPDSRQSSKPKTKTKCVETTVASPWTSPCSDHDSVIQGSVLITDIDADGAEDLIFGCWGRSEQLGQRIEVGVSLGPLSLRAANNRVLPIRGQDGTHVLGIELADVDGDGKPDVVLADKDGVRVIGNQTLLSHLR